MPEKKPQQSSAREEKKPDQKNTGKQSNDRNNGSAEKEEFIQLEIPQIALPKGGGAIKSIDEKFTANASNGTASLQIPIPVSQARDGFVPTVGLSYNSGSGNSTFGLGWNLSLPAIARKTEKGLPQYKDSIDSDTYLMSASEDLVPSLQFINNEWQIIEDTRVENGITYRVKRYRPRIEKEFLKLERWTDVATGIIHWKTLSKNNVTGIYGRSAAACVADPLDPTRIFEWLPELSYDDRGNCITYHYKAEDDVNVPNLPSENHRKHLQWPFAYKYLEKVKYGAKTPYDPATGTIPDLMFETMFDYNESAIDPNSFSDTVIDQLNNNWSCRQDPFSTYNACFERRSYRLCYRVWLFHRFQELGVGPYLVGSLSFNYQYDALAGLSFLQSVISTGYKRTNNIYSSKQLPPFQLHYQASGWDTTVHNMSIENLENLPGGLDDNNYLWIDLYKEGVAGILSEQRPGLFYKANLGGGEFEKQKMVISRPSFTGLSGNQLQFQDLHGDGRTFAVSYNKEYPGYYELKEDGHWEHFKNFQSIPNVNFKDPNTKFIDLDGDGKADLLVTEETVFCWYPSKGVAGYDDFRFVRKEWDEEKGPAIVFYDNAQSIMLADMNGDGLTDIVRVRNGEIVYWPNLGYGKFGAKIIMDNSPWMDAPELFNTKNVRLADINGSGSTDLVYIRKDSFNVWFNLSGNGWSVLQAIEPFPAYDSATNISLIDLLGHGTSCIVWSSPLPANSGTQMRYIDLMGGKKPFMLAGYENNMGKRVLLEYKSSTRYYLDDKKAGKHWITRIAFPVQCVDKIITEDIEFVDGQPQPRLRFTRSYTYHHGYYDHIEREFRGFGRVEQTDTEDFDHFILNNVQNVVQQDLHQPPIKTITWFHTGVYFDKERILNHFSNEYTKGPWEFGLPEPILPDELSPIESREAARACKGFVLRKEVYALDGSPLQDIPYSTDYHSCLIRKLQPKNDNRYAVFFITESEAINYGYERNLDDPRINHVFNLEVDEFGNVIRSAAIVYGRKTVDQQLPAYVRSEQAKTHFTFQENEVTNFIDLPNAYRLPGVWDIKTHELTGITPQNNQFFTYDELLPAFASAVEIGYEQTPNHVSPQRRLTRHQRYQYLDVNLQTPLPFGFISAQGFVHQTFKKAFTPAILTAAYTGRVTDAMLTTAGYLHLNDTNWWISSGTNILLENGESIADARNRFYTPVLNRDPFGNETRFVYDGYFFMLTGTIDALQNTTQCELIDYRVLKPIRIRDINDNISEAVTDELGLVIATSGRGTDPLGNRGDAPIDTYNIIPVVSFADVMNDPHKYLQNATSFFYYDHFAFMNRQQPVCFASIYRETHVSDLQNQQLSRLQLSASYLSGLAQTLQTKVIAEPGEAFQWQNGQKTVVDTGTTPRWAANGRVIMNNKGNPVKEYEPFFSTTHEYESEKELVEIGFSSVLYYDPLSRNIRTERPQGSFKKTVFDAWKQQVFDENDTVLESQWYIDRGSPNPAGPEPADAEQRAAWLAAKHANTCGESHLDSRNRSIYNIMDNGADGKYGTTIVLNSEGNQLRTIDARNNIALDCQFNMLRQILFQNNMDAGNRWIFADVTGKTFGTWDERNHFFHTEYDALNRPLQQWLTNGNIPGDPARLIGFSVYGEGLPNDKQLNLRGKTYRSFSQAGMTENTSFEFKGGPLESRQQLAIEYKQTIDWNIPDPLSLLENETFVSTTKSDALNRPIEITTPDGSIFSPVYNEGNALKQMNGFLIRQNSNTEFVRSVSYNAKGQRERILYGNNTTTRYTYEEKTFRLSRVLTTRNNGADILQDLNYTYDATGNLVELRDDAQQTNFFNNAMVTPHNRYEYDAIYRLRKARGREHAGQNAVSDQFDNDKMYQLNGNHLQLKGDMNAMQRYEELYTYDAVGNMLSLVHNAGNGNLINQWTKTFNYGLVNNRLLSLSDGNALTNYNFDAHGNMLNLQNGQFGLVWNYSDQIKEVDLGGGGTAYYVYDASGSRIRKVIENGNLVKERIYLGNYEIYRERTNNNLNLERETLHIMDNAGRIALVESRTSGNDPGVANLIRYQYNNHLGTACLELDGNAAGPEIISYEEYYPFGNTAYQAVRNQTETPKRYRYTGKERDEETGLYYHGSRYYACWLCRWTTTDPIGVRDGINIYLYCRNNPIGLKDSTGNECGVDETCVDQEIPLREDEVEAQACFEESESVCELPPDPPKPPPVIYEGGCGHCHPVPEMTQRAWDEKNEKKYDLGTGELYSWNELGTLFPAGEPEPSFTEKMSIAWEKADTSEKVVIGATGVGTASMAVPYFGDWISLGASVVVFVAEPSWGNLGGIGLDVIGAAAPGVPALGTIKRIDDISDIAQTANRTSDVVHTVDAAVTAEKTVDKAVTVEKAVETAADVKQPPIPFLSVVEIKPNSVSGIDAGWTQAMNRGDEIGKALEEGGLMGVAVYDRTTGIVTLEVRTISGFQDTKWVGKIGEFTPQQIAEFWKQAGKNNTTKFGNVIEDPIRKMISDATGQAPDVISKHPSANGADWLPLQLPLPFVH